jgi:sulfatase-like protein
MAASAPTEPRPHGLDDSAPKRQTTLGATLSLLRHPGVIVSLLLALCETVPAIHYGRALVALEPVTAALSFSASFVGTAATYWLVIRLAPGRRWSSWATVLGIAVVTVLLELIYFGIHREFSTLPTVSIADFVRQNSMYARTLFLERLDAAAIAASLALAYGVARIVQRGFEGAVRPGHQGLLGAGLVIVLSLALSKPPFMSMSQHTAWLLAQSSHGPGLVNAAWIPDRVEPLAQPAQSPLNIIVFRLEEVAAQATTLVRPELPTTPFLKALIATHPDESFVAHQHFSNATATDVSVLSIFTGLAPAAPLEAHRRIPLLWDYFAAAGYDTSLFLPDHLEWGDFRRRFEARPGELNLRKVVDAGNSGHPLVYDHSLNDTGVIADALAYQEQRHWAEPFLQIVSLRMPHAIGEGARINHLDHGPWQGEPPELRDYHNAIVHDDALMHDFLSELPEPIRQHTAVVVVSDHGSRLFARNDGAVELNRLDNYHQETTLVPFLIWVPQAAQQQIPAAKLEQLRSNFSSRATSNLDMVPTLLGLAGITPVVMTMDHPELLLGRDLTTRVERTPAIVQLNTGPLRRWDREHFALVVDDGAYHYLFSMGRELLFNLQQDPLERTNLIREPAFGGVASRSRALAAALPELARIQHKYRAAAATAPASDTTPAPGMYARVAPTGVIQVTSAPGAGDRALAEYVVVASHAAVQVTVLVRVLEGHGGLEWRLQGAGHLDHHAHIEGLRPGHLHRLQFRWRSASSDGSPLSLQLFGNRSSGGDLTLRLEQAEAHVISPDMTPGLEIVALEHQPARGSASLTYHLDRFTRHGCASRSTPRPCPDGFLMWGPYAPGAEGADVYLRYDVEARRSGSSVWFDITADNGRSELTRSRTFPLAEAASYSFALAAHLDVPVEGVEGRMNAHAAEGLLGDALAIRRAALMVVPPTNP